MTAATNSRYCLHARETFGGWIDCSSKELKSDKKGKLESRMAMAENG